MKRLKNLLFCILVLCPLSHADDPTPESAVELVNHGLIEVRNFGELDQSCTYDLSDEANVPRFLNGLSPCSDQNGTGWAEVASAFGTYYEEQDFRLRNREFRQDHGITGPPMTGIGNKELRLNPSEHIIGFPERGGANVFIGIEKVECEALPENQSPSTFPSYQYIHPLTGRQTMAREGIIRYFLPGRSEPVETRLSLSAFHSRCNSLLMAQLDANANGENFGICMAYHEASSSHFRSDERPSYYCLVGGFLKNEGECVGEGTGSVAFTDGGPQDEEKEYGPLPPGPEPTLQVINDDPEPVVAINDLPEPPGPGQEREEETGQDRERVDRTPEDDGIEEQPPEEEEVLDPDPQEELQGGGGGICCGGWTSGRSCSLCTNNDWSEGGYRDIFDNTSEGKPPTFHVVECVGPQGDNQYNWGGRLATQTCTDDRNSGESDDECCNLANYRDWTIVSRCLARLGWSNGRCAEETSN